MGKKPKAEMRTEMRAVLSNLDDRWLQAASRELCKNLSSLVKVSLTHDVQHILAWPSFFPGEADLAHFIDEQIDNRKVYLPQTKPNFSMEFISVGKNWMESLSKGEFGVLEPKAESGEIFDLANVSEAIILVPGLGFGRDGTRLGRGKGYYDHFLCRSRVVGIVKIGICWSLQLMPTVPTDSHDVHMDYICTEEGVVKVGG